MSGLYYISSSSSSFFFINKYDIRTIIIVIIKLLIYRILVGSSDPKILVTNIIAYNIIHNIIKPYHINGTSKIKITKEKRKNKNAPNESDYFIIFIISEGNFK